ncbi:polar tube protein 1 [Striga asiatica]|uniref:Polar tube protein 1 n=1 Tax=Striga asiatica TaxID=4170 RepID=A0A5A7P592_STRAF|nr:polar tube protein 1 [Striga asiatica]
MQRLENTSANFGNLLAADRQTFLDHINLLLFNSNYKIQVGFDDGNYFWFPSQYRNFQIFNQLQQLNAGQAIQFLDFANAIFDDKHYRKELEFDAATATFTLVDLEPAGQIPVIVQPGGGGGGANQIPAIIPQQPGGGGGDGVGQPGGGGAGQIPVIVQPGGGGGGANQIPAIIPQQPGGGGGDGAGQPGGGGAGQIPAGGGSGGGAGQIPVPQQPGGGSGGGGGQPGGGGGVGQIPVPQQPGGGIGGSNSGSSNPANPAPVVPQPLQPGGGNPPRMGHVAAKLSFVKAIADAFLHFTTDVNNPVSAQQLTHFVVDRLTSAGIPFDADKLHEPLVSTLDLLTDDLDQVYGGQIIKATNGWYLEVHGSTDERQLH